MMYVPQTLARRSSRSARKAKDMRTSTSMVAALSIVLILGVAPPAAAQFYTQHNLVSDGAVPAECLDPNLVNAWGARRQSYLAVVGLRQWNGQGLDLSCRHHRSSSSRASLSQHLYGFHGSWCCRFERTDRDGA